VGHETFDDAGIFVLSESLALVQTLDFFAPIVDDPYLFGQIAAANALSDVYAMGGKPVTAMNIVGFPTDKLPIDVLSSILRGGQDKVHEAGAVVAGGHSIIDDEPKYGLSVTGLVDPRQILTNAAAAPGDVLVLTKPIGTGIVATAVKRALITDADAEPAYGAMRALNAAASAVALEIGARCATDVTGFGLLGHALHIARASGVTVLLRPELVPLLPAALDLAERGVRTGGSERNEAYLTDRVQWGDTREALRALLLDPQTSGGLLIAVPASRLADYLTAVAGAVVIGEIVPSREAGVVLA
jgi:selenide,water dikinase